MVVLLQLPAAGAQVVPAQNHRPVRAAAHLLRRNQRRPPHQIGRKLVELVAQRRDQTADRAPQRHFGQQEVHRRQRKGDTAGRREHGAAGQEDQSEGAYQLRVEFRQVHRADMGLQAADCGGGEPKDAEFRLQQPGARAKAGQPVAQAHARSAVGESSHATVAGHRFSRGRPEDGFPRYGHAGAGEPPVLRNGVQRAGPTRPVSFPSSHSWLLLRHSGH